MAGSDKISSREKIISAAYMIFAERGFHGARTSEIAEAAGVNKALIHYYFETKEKLYQEVLEQIFSTISTKLNQVLEEEAEPYEKIARVITTYFDFVSQNPEARRIILRELASEGGRLRDIMPRYIRSVFKKGKEIFEKGVREGVFYPADPYHLFINLVGLIGFYFGAAPILSRILEKDLLSKENIKERKKELLSFVSKGLLRKRKVYHLSFLPLPFSVLIAQMEEDEEEGNNDKEG